MGASLGNKEAGMLKRYCTISFLLMILSFAFTPSVYSKEIGSVPSQAIWNKGISDYRELRDPIAAFYIQLITRPGITTDNELKLLIPVAGDAAVSFRSTLFRGANSVARVAGFTKELSRLNDIYRKEYTAAPEGLAGAELKGAAYDHLLEGFIKASVRFGVPLEDLDLALLHGCAVIEKGISQSPISTKLTETDRELILYLLRYTVHQERRRILLDSTKDALRNIRAVEEIRSLYDTRICQVFKPVLSREPIGLETLLADPVNFDNLNKILVSEYNLEAVCDMFAIKYGMELGFMTFDGQISPLQDLLIASIAKHIPGITPDIIKEQLQIVKSLRIPPIAVYEAIHPKLPISYSPVNGLADRLAMLGETPPAPPDFAIFIGPYRALFMLNYDILLSDLITACEWTLAENNNPDPSRPLSLSDQYAVKSSAMNRLTMIRSRIRGLPEQTARSMMTLLRASLRDRI
jgi:hypothetical protein